MRYGHIALNTWSSLPRGEEILSFILQSDVGRIIREDLVEFPHEREAKTWVERVLGDLAQTPIETVVFFDPNIEDLLFEVVNFERAPGLDHVEFLPFSAFHVFQRQSWIDPLDDAVRRALSQITTSLAKRKRSLRALQVMRGEVRWVEAFTDGSFVPHEGQGGAAFLRDDGAYGALRFYADNSNEAEFVAALIAITSAHEGEKVSINSDSRHVVRALNNLVALADGKAEPYPSDRTLGCLEQATLDALADAISPGGVRARWVRAHCGNKMNHGADRLAKAMRKRHGRPTVPSAEGIVREATGVSAPVSYGFTTIDLAVPDWYGDYLKNGDSNDVEDSSEGQFDGPVWTGAGGGAGWLAGRASA